jgi:hypothetical protein
LGSWLYSGSWPSAKTPWECAFSELRVSPEAYIHCGEGAPLLPEQLWLLGLKADFNTVDIDTLGNLPKIPAKVLVELFEEREKRGGFCYWEEVAKISGIGPVRLESLKKHLFIQCSTER